MEVPTKKVLDPNASGLRHLRWAREIVGTLIGLLSHNEYLRQTQVDVVRNEVDALARRIAALSFAVKNYRDFLERRRTLARGKVRAIEVLEATFGGDAPDFAPNEAPEHLGMAKASAEAELNQTIETERQTLRDPLSHAIFETRSHILSIGTRLEIMFPKAACLAVYPTLAEDRSAVLDSADNFDDAAR